MSDAHTTIPIATDTGGGDAFTIPEAYKDKPYMKDIDSNEKLFAQFDNVQSLIGKKTVGIPTSESSEEDWGKFYNSMGRPEESGKYEFDKVDGPEGIDLQGSEEGMKKVKDMFHKAGLSGKQAKDIKKAYDEMFLEQYGKQLEAGKVESDKVNTEFEGLLDSHFGDQKEAASTRVNQMLTEFTPDGFKEHVQGLDNKNLMVLTAVLDKVHQKYVSEDGAPGGGDAIPAETVETMRETAQNLIKSDAWKNPMDTQHEATKAKVNALYTKIATAQTKK